MSFRVSDAYIDVEFRVDEAEAKLKSKMANLDDAKIKVDADTRPADARLSALQRKAQSLDAAKVKVDADIVAATAKVDELKSATVRKIQEIEARKLKVDADITLATLRLTELKAKAAEATGDVKVKADADVSAAEAKLAGLRVRADSLTDARLKVDADITLAESKVDSLKRKASELGAQRATINVDASTATPDAKLAATKREADSLDGKNANVKVDANVSAALAKIALVSAAIAGLGTLAVAGIGGIAGLGAVVGAGIGSLGASLTGVGGAVKALGTANTGAGGAASKAADNHLQLASAIDRVKSAQASLANTQANTASQIARADEAIVTAKDNLTRAYADAAFAAESSAGRVTDAETRLADAQDTERQAQEDLTSARRTAAQQLQDLQTRVEDLALSERSAQLSVAEAKQNLDKVNADGRSTDLQKQRAQLSYDEAVQRVKDLAIEQQRAADAKQAADAKGIDGSDAVTAAQARIVAAQKQVADAEKGVSDAREAQARQAVQSQNSIADATRRVADAETSAADARRQAAFSIAQAQQSIVDAQRAVQQASQQAGAAGGGGVDKIAQAFARLSPVAQEFARFLRGFIDGPLQELRTIGQNNLLPGLQRGLEGAVPILKQIQPQFAAFSKTLGDAFAGAIPAVAKLAGPLLDFASAALKGLSPLSGVLDSFTSKFTAMVERVTANGSLEQAMNGVVQIIGVLLDNLPGVIEVGLQLFNVLGPPLADAVNALLPAITALATALGPILAAALTALVPLLNQFTAFTLANPDLVGKLAVGFVALGVSIGPIVGALPTILKALGGLSVTSVAVIAGVLALAAGFIYLYKHSETLRQNVSLVFDALKRAGSTIATAVMPALRSLGDTLTTKVAPAFTRLLNVLLPIYAYLVDKLAPVFGQVFKVIIDTLNGALQVIAGAVDVFTGIFTHNWQEAWDGVKNIFSGAVKGIVSEAQSFFTLLNGPIGAVISKIPGLGDVGKAIQDLGKSSVDLGGNFSDMSGRAESGTKATEGLGKSIDGVKDKSDAAKTSTDKLNDAIQKITSTFLGARGAEVGYYQAVDRATQAAKENGRTLDVHTEKGRANRTALDDQAKAALGYIKALQDQGAPSAQVLAQLAAQRTSLIQSGERFGLTKAEAKKYADQILATPKAAVTAVSITGIPTANAQLQTLLDRIAIVNGKLVTLQVAANAANVREDRTAIPARAKGGPVEKGQPYIVGDGGNGSGAELFVPDESGKIIPDIGLLRRGINTGAATGAGIPQQRSGSTITIGTLALTLPTSVQSLTNMSDTEKRRFGQDIRDLIVNVEAGQR